MTNSNPTLRFLFIEDSQKDLVLLVRELKRAGLAFEYAKATTMVLATGSVCASWLQHEI